MAEQQPWASLAGIPEEYFLTPSSARVWDYWLGGKDNYPADRAAGDEFIRKYPEILTIARQSRKMLARVVRYLAGEAGIRQFLDIGTGLPTMQNTHEVAQAIAPESKIVYVDNDPLVLAHARALLTNTTDEGVTTYVHADVRDPELIIADARNVLNFREPLAVLLLGILGHAAATFEEMRSITAALVDALPTGGYLVIADGVDTGESAYLEAAAARGYHPRTLDEFRACFDGLELVEPGLVPRNRWRPVFAEAAEAREPMTSYVAVGRKP
ncbi:SAM-dependent methyltransferase [Pseudonocardia acaciae]|uniref:SAM-dependent methyltransferase n=1 Tax=Pseudonocardia acaciae TaxID=551276 RepID=UPI000688B053|nr:SAM-dependent methyltransferase [Pseudonocardia acaciae]